MSPQKEKLGVGIRGAGQVSYEHAKAIRSNPRLKTIPVVIFSSNMETAQPSVLGLADKLLFKGECTFQNLLKTIEDLLASSPNYGGA